MLATEFERFAGRRHAVLCACLLERQQVCEPAILEYITDRSIAITVKLGWRLRLHIRTSPDRKQLSGQPVQGPENQLGKIYEVMHW